ncbi:type I pullulanase [Vagococcus acidifermentans]|uniref:type I pullulanase n=1 Tax=Vagococcus acidifermentans TaxID=564710 RepID=UPI000F862FC2|nr:type I pullulanase [Vagococcus acidifermentans]
MANNSATIYSKSYLSQSTNPETRIIEMKQMVQGLHDNGLRVIMDVVYNHVFEASSHAFNQTVPGYYFRYDENGNLANGTGVGNDTASERKMMSKYIVDSVKYWAETYHLDGFRFDLMGILDVDTMNAVRAEMNKIDPSIIILGEGWDMGTPLASEKKATQKNAAQMPAIAHFNDSLRDGVKGSVFEETAPGFINGKDDMEKIVAQNITGANGLEGYIAPDQVIQYVEAHDNLTLFDKLSFTNPEDTDEQRLKRHMLGTSIPLLSQGITFIHAGQEFLRTKGGDENSYKSPDSVNQFDWSRPETYKESVNFFKKLVKLRKEEPLFRLQSYEEIAEKTTIEQSEDNVIVYRLKDGTNEYVVILNANDTKKEVTSAALTDFELLLDNRLESEKQEKLASNEVLPLSVSVYKKEASEQEKPETAVQYDVVFDSNGGSKVPSQKVSENEKAVKPVDPTKDGYDFAGWFMEKEFTNAFDFDSLITEKLTLYAKWEKQQESTASQEKTDNTNQADGQSPDKGKEKPVIGFLPKTGEQHTAYLMMGGIVLVAAVCFIIYTKRKKHC